MSTLTFETDDELVDDEVEAAAAAAAARPIKPSIRLAMISFYLFKLSFFGNEI
jgi:hypothetical protein